ncbi:19866_t:CDS:2, partial [Rhizophagus irregularis]
MKHASHLYDARTPYINVTLKEYFYLSLFNSDRHNDRYEFKNSGLCPECGKKHDKGKIVGRCIKSSYYIKCQSLPREKEIKVSALPENSSGEKLPDVNMSTVSKDTPSVKSQ